LLIRTGHPTDLRLYASLTGSDPYWLKVKKDMSSHAVDLAVYMKSSSSSVDFTIVKMYSNQTHKMIIELNQSSTINELHTSAQFHSVL